MGLRNNKNRDTKTFFYFYKILPLHIFNIIIHRTRGTDKNINKRADKKINRNKTPK